MSAALPLSGIRVIELCWVWSGPLLGQYLADLGAEVIKVEWYKRYDLYRTRGVERMAGRYPEFIRREMSQSFHGLNRNKIGVTLDLKVEKHRDGLLDLARETDLVIENFTSGTLNRLGVGYEALRKANPGIVLLSLSGFGSSSRLSDMRAYGLVLSALSGLEANIVDPETSEFVGTPTFVASDPNAATYGLFASIAAIVEAKQTGKGAHIELSQLEAIAHAATDNDEDLKRLAKSLGLTAEFESNTSTVLRTADQSHVCVAWPSKMTETDIAALSKRVQGTTIDAATTLLNEAGVQSVRVIEQPAEVGAGATKEGTLITTIHPTTGPEDIVAAPWWIDGHRAPLRKTAPTLGEGNDYVLGSLLGWSTDDRNEISNFDVERRHGSK
ncbi:MAG: CoA transferase [Alphaproteobacteria bacterium]|nr:CoA transferase [Alphaproteobacteria bacterium]